MIKDEIVRKVYHMDYSRLTRLANWLTNRYWQKDTPELAHLIMVHQYHQEEARAGLL